MPKFMDGIHLQRAFKRLAVAVFVSPTRPRPRSCRCLPSSPACLPTLEYDIIWRISAVFYSSLELARAI